jgi:hypothetical protein
MQKRHAKYDPTHVTAAVKEDSRLKLGGDEKYRVQWKISPEIGAQNAILKQVKHDCT